MISVRKCTAASTMQEGGRSHVDKARAKTSHDGKLYRKIQRVFKNMCIACRDHAKTGVPWIWVRIGAFLYCLYHMGLETLSKKKGTNNCLLCLCLPESFK